MPDTPPTQGPPPQVIFLIRHAEKPEAPTDTGVDVTGAPNPACLTPQGWQRAAGLARLFDTAAGTTRPDLAVPTHLYSPAYPNASVNHRTYETLLPLSQRLGLPINTSDPEGPGGPTGGLDSGQRCRGQPGVLGTQPHSRHRRQHSRGYRR